MLRYYRLYLCHYFSRPGLSWDAMLEITKIELELISDIDMYLFIEKESEEVFLTLLKDILKQIMNRQIMTVVKKVILLCI